MIPLLDLSNDLFVDKGEMHFRSRTWSKSEFMPILRGTPLRALISFWVFVTKSPKRLIRDSKRNVKERSKEKKKVSWNFCSVRLPQCQFSPKTPKNFCKVRILFVKVFWCHWNFSYFPAAWLRLGRIAYKSPGCFPRPTVISESSRWKELTWSIFGLSSPVCNLISLLFLHLTG